MSATRFFLHLDDPVFEPFGGIYIPYNTEEGSSRPGRERSLLLR
jgi:hypothetical protein